MTTFQEWRNQLHTTHNTGIPDGHLEAQQAKARRLIAQIARDRGPKDCALDHVPWEPEGNGDYTAWPMTPGCRMQIFERFKWPGEHGVV